MLAAAEIAFLVERLIPSSEVLKSVPGLEVDLKTKESLAHGRTFVWALPEGLSARPAALCVLFEGELIGLVEPLDEMEGEFALEAPSPEISTPCGLGLRRSFPFTVPIPMLCAFPGICRNAG